MLGDQTAYTIVNSNIDISGIATTPILGTGPATGTEDQPVNLNITASLADPDSETLTVTISGLPAGATLSAGVNNGDGTWTLTPGELTGLQLLPAPGYNGTATLTVTAVSSENGTTAVASGAINLTVTGIADAPVLTAQPAAGLEDTAIALNISAVLAPGDHGNLSITVSGVPAGATLSAGINNGDGSWTLTPAQLAGLTLTPPANFNGSLDLAISATATENGTTASSDTTLHVIVADVADVPVLTAAPAVGLEDSAISLNIAAALAVGDTGTLSVTISGVPAGATLSAGINNGDGSWTLTPAQLSGLTLTPPANFNGGLDLTIAATATDGTTSATANAGLHVTVANVEDAPVLNVLPAVGLEDSAISLSIVTALALGDSGTIAVTISGVPAGATLSAGVNNGDGSWTLTSAQLAGLTLTPPANFNGGLDLTIAATATDGTTSATANAGLHVTVANVEDAPVLAVLPAAGLEDSAIALNITAGLAAGDSGSITVTISGVPAGAVLSAGTNNGDGTWTLTTAQLAALTLTPPANFNGSLDLGVQATATDGTTTATSGATLHVAVANVEDAPVLSVQAAAGLEGSPIGLSISTALAAGDTGTISITLSGVPAGATLSAGINNGDGTWTLTQAQLTGLAITPPPFFNGTLDLGVSATATDGTTSASSSTTLHVGVGDVADTPLLNVTAAVGLEDTAIALNITAAMAVGDTGTLSLTISGVPAGATLSAGINNGDGSWTLTPAQLAGLSLTPPANFNGSLDLSVQAVTTEGATTADATATLHVTVGNVEDAPILAVLPAVGLEDTPIALNIAAAFAPGDSGTLSVTISGVPAGATLSAGINNGNGSWTLTAAQLPGLTLTPPANFNGGLDLSVQATASDGSTSASAGATLHVAVANVEDAPVLAVLPAIGLEATPIALTIAAGLAPGDTGALSITISGVPAGANLSAGINNGDGSWTLTPAQLTGLTLTPPLTFNGGLDLGVQVTATDGTTSATSNATLHVSVGDVADMPVLAVLPSLGAEDTAIALHITAALALGDTGVLTVTVSGVPAGAALSAGTNNGDGSWTLTPAQLGGLTLTPPANFNGSLDLTVHAVTDDGTSTADATAPLHIVVTDVSDTPVLSVQAASGAEDSAIGLNISTAFAAGDAGILLVTISGVPAGATLSAGFNNGGGSWTLTPAQLSGLTLTPPANFNGTLNLTVESTASDNGTSAQATATLPVNVTGVADAPALTVTASAGLEDTAIALHISTALATGDHGTLAVTISGVPAGAALSAGINNGDGTWTLSAAQLSGLTLTPPANFSGSLDLGVQSTATENSTTASSSASLHVSIAGVPDVPLLSVSAAIGLEDTPIHLGITAALTDISETLSLTVSGVPAGATLSAGVNNGNGTWTLTAADLANLTLTPAQDFNGSLTLHVTATSTQDGSSVSTALDLGVSVLPVADAPLLLVQAAVGLEDNSIPLVITLNPLGQTVSVDIAGLPAGATLSAGINNGNGSWTLTPAQLIGLTVTPPHDFNGNLSLSVTATAEEGGTTASTTASLGVNVIAVPDAPSLNVVAATGLEDTAIPLSIAAAIHETGEALSMVITGVPAGATLSAGVNNGGGQWTVSASDLSNLSLTPPANFNGSISLQVQATSSENGYTASTAATLGVTVQPVADAPVLALLPALGNEDSAINLNVSAALATGDHGVLSITIGNVPAGAALSAGINNGDGTWTLTAAQLSGLTITPPANFNGTLDLSVAATATEAGTSATANGTLHVTVADVADIPVLNVLPAIGLEDTAIGLTIGAGLALGDHGILSVTISGVPASAALSAGTNNGNGTWTLTAAQLSGLTITPPANFNGTLDLGVQLTATDGATSASASTTLHVTVTDVADIPTLAVLPAVGLEDAPVALNIAAGLALGDTGVLSVTVTGVPAGGILSAGTHNGDGSWTLTPAQLGGLTLTPPANFNGSLDLGVQVTSSVGGTSASANATLHVTVTDVADAPVLTALPAVGFEDTPVALNIVTALALGDGGVLSVNVNGLPAGATLSAGIHNGDGSWTLTPAQLAGLTLIPGSNYSGNFTLAVTATTTDNGTQATTATTLGVAIAPVGDTPALSVMAASGAEDSAISLHINAAATDPSETVSVNISGIPAGATLSAGIHNGDGSWTLTTAQLSGLTLTPPANFYGALNLQVTALSSQPGPDGVVTQNMAVTVTPVADAPLLAVVPAVGIEDIPVALGISTALANGDGGILLVTVTGMPAGATLSAGTHNGDGSWTLTQAQLTGLTLTPPANFGGTFNLGITSTSVDGGTSASSTATLGVTVAGVPDVPHLTVSTAIGFEDAPVGLNISAALVDTTYETLDVVISGVPAGATLSAGTNNGNGSWTLTGAQLAGLQLNPPANFNGDITLNVTAESHQNGSTATVSANLGVTVLPMADTPILTVSAATGLEDTAIALDVNAALAAGDGGLLSVTITGVPAGALLTAGINAGGGTWTLTPSQLTGLAIIPPQHWSGSLALGVTATATDITGSESANATLNVTVNGVATMPLLHTQAVAGIEDTAIPLAITAALADTDGSETLAVTVSGVPTGATLSAGVNQGGGVWLLSAVDVVGLTLTPPSHWSGTLTLGVTATSTEGITHASASGNVVVAVAGVATPPSLNVSAAAGNEDTAIALTINAALNDTDGSETLQLLVTGVPLGGTLSAGINLGGGAWILSAADTANLKLTPPAHWSGSFNLNVIATSQENATTSSVTASLPVTVTGTATAATLNVSAAAGNEDTAIALAISGHLNDTDGSESLSYVISGVPTGALLSAGLYAGGGKWSLTDAQLAGLTITPPANFSGSISLQVSAISMENNGDVKTVTSTLPVTVAPVADAPVLAVANVVGLEDTAIVLPITALLRDLDGSETLSVRITGIPALATLSAGTHNGDGSWTLTQAQLTGLKVTPAPNSDADFTLGITATSTDGASTASTSASVTVTVTGVADVPTIAASLVTGLAGAIIPLSISGGVADSDGSETITYHVQGVPDGFALSAGINNGDNTWTLTAAQIAGVKVITPPSFNGDLTLYASAVSHDSDGSVSTSASVPFHVQVGNYASGYLVDLGVNANLGGVGVGVHVGVLPDVDLFPASGGLLTTGGIYMKEDTPIMIGDAPNLLALPVLSGLLSLVSKVQFSGVPAGVTFSSGTNVGGGVWTFTNAQLVNLTMTTPANSDVDFTITTTALMLLGILPITLSSTVVHVTGVADTPTLSVGLAATGTEDTPVALNITSALTDTDGSETLTFLVSGMPTGFTLNHGINNGDGTWSLTASDAAGLTITPASNFSGTASVTVSAVATEREGDQTVVRSTSTINFTGVADAPIITAAALSTTEDHAINLGLGVALRDTDGSEHLNNIIITGVPTGGSLTNATDNHDGSWSITPANLASVQFVPPTNFHGDITLGVSASSQENAGGAAATSTSTIGVHVDAVADTPIASATNSTGTAGSDIGLHLSAALADSGETLSLVVSGLPDHAMLSAGLNNGDGSWTLKASDLSTVSIRTPDAFTGDLHLSLTAYSTEANGSTASATQAFTVHVDAAPAPMAMMAHMSLAADGWLGGASTSGGNSVDTSIMSDPAPVSTGNDMDHAFTSSHTS
ncbi:MAG: tandem-95 repeat protein [Micavibrio sp.]|nr:tandem-95 repeat protein [Micavibrio sp.]